MIYNMSYPREDQVMATRPPPARPAKPKARPVVGEPFDPNELSRRLQVVLTEQKAKADKRRARAEAERQGRPAPLGATGAVKDGGAFTATWRPTTERRPAKEDPPKAKPPPNDDSSSSGRRSGEGKLSSKLVKLRKLSRADLASDAAKEQASPQPYVPKVAAQQFTRTTTAVNMRGSTATHRLSMQALKSHDAAMDRTRAGKKPHGQRDKSREQQQQHRHSRILEEPPEAENEPAVVLPTHRHTIEGHDLGRDPEHAPQHYPRRSSTGDMMDADRDARAHRQSILLMEGDDVNEGPIDPAKAGEHRVDWTQSDETNGNNKPREQLRTKMSIWTLRGRLGSLTKHSRDEKPVPAPQDEKQHRGGFFAWS